MSKIQVFDEPIRNPAGDLLGMEAYAEKLADYLRQIKPPFTIGIYGEWGSGKTSFVSLLRYFLTQATTSNPAPGGSSARNVKFITISAWPHTTADTLWRALIIQIAKGLYNISGELAVSAQETQPPQPSSDFFSWFTDLFTEKRLVLWQSPATNQPQSQQERDQAEYDKLIATLDGTSYGSVSRDTEQQLQINQEVALMAIVNAAIGALGAISPLVAAFQGFLGPKSKYDLSDLLHKEKNKATRQAIESVQEFKEVFRGLFDKKAGQYDQVLVFIDDLDRCLPDVALDILEAIKIFLDEVNCIFIVAADENLIGQGLRLRYRDLLASDNNKQTQDFFARKGQEYFEKVIQFGIRVPPRTPEQIQTFVALQFPEWIVATDIIQTAVGSNPRRLIQHCNLLSYQNEVAAITEGTQVATQQLDLCDKMIALYALYAQDKSGHTLINQLLPTPADYLNLMRGLEERFLRDPESQAQDGRPANPVYNELLEIGLAFPAIVKVFQEWKPLFASADEFEVATFLSFVDIAPAPETLQISLYTQDKVVMRILDAIKSEVLQDSPLESPHIGVPEKQSNAQRFNFKNIRTLFIEGFNDDELRRLCYDEPNFRPVYEQLTVGMGKANVIDKLIEYAERKELIEMLLALAKEHNPAKYEKYQPYDNLTASFTRSGGTHEKS
jgi:hypothetical protein